MKSRRYFRFEITFSSRGNPFTNKLEYLTKTKQQISFEIFPWIQVLGTQRNEISSLFSFSILLSVGIFSISGSKIQGAEYVLFLSTGLPVRTASLAAVSTPDEQF